MPNASVPPSRHYDHRKTTKKKKKKRAFPIILGVFALLLLMGAVVLGNYIEFTPEGMRFVTKGEEGDEIASVDSITPLPQPVLDGDMPIPTVKPQFDIVYNGLPVSGRPEIDANAVDVRSKTSEELAIYASWLYDTGAESVVIELKGADGRICYASGAEMASEYDRINLESSDKLAAFIADCRSKGIVVIGVIHAFADNIIPRSDMSHALTDENGALYVDENYNTRLNPADAEVRRYVLDLAAEAAEMGVRELILDDFSFPNDPSLYPETEDRTECILSLLAQIRETVGDMRLGVVIYNEVAGEGFNETRGLEITRIDSLCDRIWMHISELGESISYHGSLANLTEDGGSKLCVMLDGEYMSDGYYIERYKQANYSRTAEDE